MKQIRYFILSFLFLLCIFDFNANAADADAEYRDHQTGIGRVRKCSADAAPESIDFDPSSGGKDVMFDLSNPVCVTVVATSYAAVKIAISVMNINCATGSSPRIAPSLILDIVDLYKAGKIATETKNPSCVASVGAAVASFATWVAQLGIIHKIAEDVYKDARVCGARHTYKSDGWIEPNSKNYTISSDGSKKIEVKNVVKKWVDSGDIKSKDKDKDYILWINDGVEVEDNVDSPEKHCEDPTNGNNKQLYYMRGFESGNFNCEKYDPNSPANAGKDSNAYKDAYECCKYRSSNFICIEYGKTKKFCRSGKRCEIEGIYFDIKSLDNNRMICAQTYSLCPYNFYLGGGSEICDYYKDGIENDGSWQLISQQDVDDKKCSQKSEIRNDDCTYNKKAGRCRNYCQYFAHCTKTSYVNKYQSSLSSPYFSVACLNFVGDSLNKESISGEVIGRKNVSHFTAPIAQCVKETMENFFYNKVGHSQCVNNSVPINGVCEGDNYLRVGNFTYKKGQKIAQQSFLEKIQNNLRRAITLTLIFSVIFYGMKTLLAVAEIKKSEILMYVVRLGLVMYFALGTAWNDVFFQGIYNVSTEFSRIVFKLQANQDENKRDRCQFGDQLFDKQGNKIETKAKYPEGKEYLSMWDTLDCKIAFYLGIGQQASYANIAGLIIAGFFTGTVGLYFSFALSLFAIFLISAAIRALHIFLLSAIAIVIMCYVSPITITLSFFQRTQSIFKDWLKQLITFSLQPIILFAYLGVFIFILDSFMIGSASFTSSKTLNCSKFCKNKDDGKINFSDNCDTKKQTSVDPQSDSMLCILNNSAYKKSQGFEMFGIGITLLDGLFNENAKEKIFTVIKSMIILYILSQFMDQVPLITSQLIGGQALETTSINAKSIYETLSSASGSVQSRAKGAIRNIAGKGIDKIKELSKSDERNVKEQEQQKSQDNVVENSGGGGSSDNVTGQQEKPNSDNVTGGS